MEELDDAEDWGRNATLIPLKGPKGDTSEARLAENNKGGILSAQPNTAKHFEISGNAIPTTLEHNKSLQKIHVRDANGIVRTYADECVCKECCTQRMLFFSAALGFEDNTYTMEGKIDTGALVSGMGSNVRPLFYNKQCNYAEIRGFSSTQRDTGLVFSEAQATCSTGGGRTTKVGIGNVVTAACIKDNLISIATITQGQSFMFGKNEAWRIDGHYKLNPEITPEYRVPISRSDNRLWNVEMELNGKKIIMAVDSEANMATMKASDIDIHGREYKMEVVSGYNDLKAVGTMKVVQNVKMTFRDTKGKAQPITLKTVATSDNVTQNLIPLKWLLEGDNDRVILHADGGHILRGGKWKWLAKKDTKITELKCDGESYVMTLQLNADNAKQFYSLPKSSRDAIAAKWATAD